MRANCVKRKGHFNSKSSFSRDGNKFDASDSNEETEEGKGDNSILFEWCEGSLAPSEHGEVVRSTRVGHCDSCRLLCRKRRRTEASGRKGRMFPERQTATLDGKQVVKKSPVDQRGHRLC